MMMKTKKTAAERQERPPKSYPWLVYSHGKGNKNQIFCTISNPTKTYVPKLSQLLNKTCLASAGHGWYLYSSIVDCRCLFLWNPITSEKKTLPLLNLNCQYSQSQAVYIDYCILSSTPSEPGCTVFLFVLEPRLIVYCDDGEWIEFAYFDELKQSLEKAGQWRKVQDHSKNVLYDPVCCNGNLYAVTRIGFVLVQIQIIQPNSLKIQALNLCPLPDAASYAYDKSKFLTESCGQLFTLEIVYTNRSFRDIVGIDIHGFDFAKKVWLKIRSAKDRAFFLSFNNKYNRGHHCVSSCPITEIEGIEGNRVYFTLADDHKKLYSYNIEEGNISVSPPFLNLPSRQSSSIWVMPDLRLANTLKEVNTSSNMEEQGSGKVHENVKYLKDVEGTIDTEAHLPHLPFDIVKLIAERLFLVDYLHFRATCKLLHSASPPIQWRIEAQRLENPALSPWLVLFGKESGYSFVDPKHGEIYHINLPQAINESSIICSSKDGWLLVTVDLLTFFFNPFTQAILPLPDFFGIRNSCMGFSSTPSSSECVAVEIEQGSNKPKFVVHFCSPGDEYWDECEGDDTDFLFDCNSPVFYREAFYFLGREGYLGILKLNDEEPSFKVLTKPKPPCNGNLQRFLVECNGELLSVFVAPFGKWVRVFKLNESKMTWTRVENLGNYMLYVSRSSSLSTIAKTPGMENKIYFPRFYGQSIVFYSLETDDYHSFESTDVVNFYSTTEELYCGWIEARWC